MRVQVPSVTPLGYRYEKHSRIKLTIDRESRKIVFVGQGSTGTLAGCLSGNWDKIPFYSWADAYDPAPEFMRLWSS